MITPRPTRKDVEILQAAARTLAPKVKEWLADHETTLDEIEADLVKVLKYRDDGYDLANSLDGQYSPDAALVEILDEASFAKSRALTIAEAKWVEATGIQAIPLETKVRWPAKSSAGIGIVTANHGDGKSTVMFESLGHVREGIGSHGYLVEWEKLEVVS